MRTLTIGNNEYIIEFSIEASLHKECIDTVTGLMTNVAMAKSKADIRALISAMSNVPQTALHMLHAGLLEHQPGLTIEKTKSILKEYMVERKGKEDGNYYSLMELLLEDMENDDFFEMIGLDKMFQTNSEEAEEMNKPKKPQDHKKKSSTKVTEK